MKYQVTLYNPDGKYKPVSCIIIRTTETTKQELVNKGVIKICQKHYWTNKDLKRYNYTKVKIRKYEEE